MLPLMMIAALSGGCVDVYQPMSGLHRPIAIDPGYANFEDLDVSLRCLSGPALDSTDAGTLCRRVSRLFENQGARVTVRTGAEAPVDDAPAGDERAAAEARPRAALSIEIAARVVNRESTHYLFVEYLSDYTVAQDITIRDETGFLLVRDTLTGRFVTRVGFFSDAEEQFSGDFYGQMSQLALNAAVRRRVLAEGKARPGPG